MVGIVVVSHSEALAEGVVRLAREMAGEGLAIEAAGGIEEPDVLGTDAERVRAAIERAMSEDGVLVLMDLGSALMSAEFAVELLEGAAGRVRLSAAPVVEGAVAAAVAASGGASLDEVAAEARGALAMKTSQIPDDVDAPSEADGAGADADVTGELAVRNAIGLHARPAARFVETVRRFDADVRVARAGDGTAVRAGSLTNLVALGARFGDVLTVTAAGPEAAAAVRALQELADGGFGDGVAAAAAAAPATPPGLVAQPEVTQPPASGAALAGVAASAGVAIGPAFRLGGLGEAPADQCRAGRRRGASDAGRGTGHGPRSDRARPGARHRAGGRRRRRHLRRPSGAALG